MSRRSGVGAFRNSPGHKRVPRRTSGQRTSVSALPSMGPTSPTLTSARTVDTTGLTTGSWALKLFGTPDGPTDFAGVPVTVTDGLLHVPESAAHSSLLIFAAAL